ncbi:MAG: recombinase family protein [Spirochaetales bacterium]|uniref:Recombinase family protein n=1 Tax=Candidatus Thalassospirochaeta sargassi TaxID=3119039 RepID=A0AAJ1IER2_9SPIO|nr:recombinase family protein [Spirochaetales bacterium]
MAKYYGYCRVSTEEQSEHSLENQSKYLKIQAEKIGLDYAEYKEKKSGKNAERPILKGIIKVLEADDIIGVYDNSRLGRNTEENLNIVNQINSKGAKLQVNGKIIDINNPNDKLTLTIESAVSTYQRENQNLKSQIGMETVKEKGEWIFTSRLMGWKVGGTKRKPEVTIVEKEAEIIRYIYEEYNKGKSNLQVTNELNAKGYRTREGHTFHPASVRRYTLKPIYMGYYKIKGAGGAKGQDKVDVRKEELVKSKYYEPIVSEELWWSVYNNFRKLKRNHAQQFEYRYSFYELSSVIKCEECGTSYTHQVVKDYRNTDKIHFYYTAIHCPKSCKQRGKSLKRPIIEPLFHQLYYLAYLWQDDVEKYLQSIQFEFKQNNNTVLEDIARIDEIIKSNNRKIDNLYKVIEEGISLQRTAQKLKDLENENNDLNDEKQTLKLMLVSGQSEIDDLIDDYSEDSIDRFLKGDSSVKRNSYLSMFESVKCSKTTLTVAYKTGMKIQTFLKANSRWNIQKDFDLQIHRNGKYFVTLNYNTETDEYTVIGQNELNTAMMETQLNNLYLKTRPE